jgi:hypothetical protein
VRWYFAVDEAGSDGAPGVHARLAVLSARLVGGLEPRLLYHGARNAFTGWMTVQGVTVIDAEPPCLDALRDAARQGHPHGHSIGHWLRLAIPHLDHDSGFALYTDCDVIFRRRPHFLRLTPRVFAAGPEFAPDAWNYFNSGVMLMNMAAMRATAAALETVLRDRLGRPEPYDDQIALNQAYRGHWERLDPRLNWKPYWPMRSDAAILHFHGPKLPVIEAIAGGTWHGEDATARAMTALLYSHREYYQGWLTDLGDLLQLADIDTALYLHRLAAKLAAMRPESGPVSGHDLSFMRFRMFPEPAG